MNNPHTLEVRYIYVSETVKAAVKKALKEKGFDFDYQKAQDTWLFQFDNRIDIRLNDGRNETLATIEGKLYRFIPSVGDVVSIHAPAWNTSIKYECGFLDEVKEYRQKLIVKLLDIEL